MTDVLNSTFVLRLDKSVFATPDALADARDNLSGIVLHDPHLWLGGDEGTSIDRLTRGADGSFAAHKRFDLHGLLKLPAAADNEIDIEGLDVNGGYLWLIGSHSAKRKKADKKGEPPNKAKKAMKRLGEVEARGNRFTLARVPLDGNSEPAPEHGALTAARLKGDAFGNLLLDALRKDEHVGRFVPRITPDSANAADPDLDVVEGIPSKDNGFDVEGLAVSGNRVFLGLRGPVLRGWAMVIELQVSEAADGIFTLNSFPTGKPYLKHFLELGGLGVRDLVIDGDDLLILAGPSMDLDGPVFIHRWKGGAAAHTEDVLARKTELPRVVTVPFGVTKDHAEGLTVVTRMPLSVLVCYDSPADTRIDGADKDGVKADVFVVSS